MTTIMEYMIQNGLADVNGRPIPQSKTVKPVKVDGHERTTPRSAPSSRYLEIAENPGLSIQEWAERWGIRPRSAGISLKRMEDRGLIERRGFKSIGRYGSHPWRFYALTESED